MRIKIFMFLLILSGTVFSANVTVFVSPDSSFQALENFLNGAENIKMATYTFTSPYIMEMLKGIPNVTIIIEKSPVGGLPEAEEKILCNLQNAKIYLYNGDLRFHHAKYMIKNGESVLITTENFGENGFPKNENHGNRGFGVIVEDKEIAKELDEIFNIDLSKSDRFHCDLENYSISYEDKSGGYNPLFEPANFIVNDIRLIIAPNAVSDIINFINNASREIFVEEFYIYRYFSKRQGEDNPLLEAVINKSREGVDVKILLDSYWYNVKKDDPNSNLNTMLYVNSISKNEGLNLEARLFNIPGIEKLHGKLVIVDDSVFISSINWNKNSPTNNREVGIIIQDKDVANYFRSVFKSDWSLEKYEISILPIILVLILIMILILFKVLK